MAHETAPEIRIYRDRDELCAAVTDLAIKRIRDGLESRGVFHLALTGGEIGTLISEQLVAIWNRNPSEFTGLHIWWGDERFLPEMSEERNAHPVVQHLQSGGAIHIHEALSSDMAIDLDTATRISRRDRRYCYGFISLGVGPDGHVASLFLGHWSRSETTDVVAVHDSPKPPTARVTFSMAKINASKSVWLLAAGENKQDAVIEIFARDKAIPASFVHGTDETLFLDRAANPT